MKECKNYRCKKCNKEIENEVLIYKVIDSNTCICSVCHELEEKSTEKDSNSLSNTGFMLKKIERKFEIKQSDIANSSSHSIDNNKENKERIKKVKKNPLKLLKEKITSKIDDIREEKERITLQRDIRIALKEFICSPSYPEVPSSNIFTYSDLCKRYSSSGKVLLKLVKQIRLNDIVLFRPFHFLYLIKTILGKYNYCPDRLSNEKEREWKNHKNQIENYIKEIIGDFTPVQMDEYEEFLRSFDWW